MTQNQNLALFANNITTANNTGLYYTGTINAASHTVGTSTIANSSGVYTAVVNGSSITVGTSTIANSTGVYTGVVNAASHTVGTSTIANSTGVYTAVVNGSSITVGTSFIANTTNVYTIGTLTPVGNSSTISTILTNAAEISTVSATAANGTINYDVTTQGVLYYTTNASANWTVNFRGSSGTSLDTLMATNQAITVAFLVTQGSPAYYANVHQIDGNAVTPKWQGGTAPTAGNASGIDIYTYTIVKTASNTYTVLASQTQYK